MRENGHLDTSLAMFLPTRLPVAGLHSALTFTSPILVSFFQVKGEAEIPKDLLAPREGLTPPWNSQVHVVRPLWSNNYDFVHVTCALDDIVTVMQGAVTVLAIAIDTSKALPPPPKGVGCHLSTQLFGFVWLGCK